MSIIQIVLLVIGALMGGGLGWLIKTIQNKIKIAQLENEIYRLEKERDQFKQKWHESEQKLLETETLLSDTLAAIELLKAYQAIDDQTRKDIDELRDTFNDGKPSDETYKKYKQMIDRINDMNKDYNQGRLEARE